MTAPEARVPPVENPSVVIERRDLTPDLILAEIRRRGIPKEILSFELDRSIESTTLRRFVHNSVLVMKHGRCGYGHCFPPDMTFNDVVDLYMHILKSAADVCIEREMERMTLG